MAFQRKIYDDAATKAQSSCPPPNYLKTVVIHKSPSPTYEAEARNTRLDPIHKN